MDGLDRDAVLAAVEKAAPEVIVHQMTSLGTAKDFRRFDEEFAVTNELRTRGTDYLLEAAPLARTRRFIAQSFTGFTNEYTGTLVKTADALLNAGASQVFACASHPVLSGEAIARIAKSRLEQVIVTNTIPLTEAAKDEPKIKVLSIAGLLGRAIQSIHEETSVSSLFA